MTCLVFRFLLLSFVTAIPLLAGNIDGQVRTGARPGLSKPAAVQLLRNGELIAEQFTDLKGRFEFEGVPAGDYVVRITYPGFREQQVPLQVGTARRSKLPPVRLRPSQDSGEDGSTISLDEIRIPRAARREYDAGLQMRQRGKHAEALAHLRKAIASYPKYGEAFNEIGICLKQTGDLAGAEKAFKSAIEHNSTVSPSISLAGVLYLSQRRFVEAHRIIRTAVKANPVEGDLFFALARIYFDQDQVKEAEASALEAHSRLHRAPDVHLLLAKIYLANGNYPALLTQLETYLDENPEGPVADQVRQNLSRMKTER